jgi:hypothetical protein
MDNQHLLMSMVSQYQTFLAKIAETEPSGGNPDVECRLCRGSLQRDAKVALGAVQRILSRMHISQREIDSANLDRQFLHEVLHQCHNEGNGEYTIPAWFIGDIRKFLK